MSSAERLLREAALVAAPPESHTRAHAHAHTHTQAVTVADKVLLLSCCHSFTVTSSGGLPHANLLPAEHKHGIQTKITATTQRACS